MGIRFIASPLGIAAKTTMLEDVKVHVEKGVFGISPPPRFREGRDHRSGGRPGGLEVQRFVIGFVRLAVGAHLTTSFIQAGSTGQFVENESGGLEGVSEAALFKFILKPSLPVAMYFSETAFSFSNYIDSFAGSVFSYAGALALFQTRAAKAQKLIAILRNVSVAGTAPHQQLQGIQDELQQKLQKSHQQQRILLNALQRLVIGRTETDDVLSEQKQVLAFFQAVGPIISALLIMEDSPARRRWLDTLVLKTFGVASTAQLQGTVAGTPSVATGSEMAALLQGEGNRISEQVARAAAARVLAIMRGRAQDLKSLVGFFLQEGVGKEYYSELNFRWFFEWSDRLMLPGRAFMYDTRNPSVNEARRHFDELNRNGGDPAWRAVREYWLDSRRGLRLVLEELRRGL